MPHLRARTLPASDRAEIIRQSEIGASLDEANLVRLAESSKAFDFRRRRFVYKAGEVADALYVIAAGRVKLCSVDESTGREAVIDIVGRGALFGESSLYSAGVREKCAIAYEQARLLRIPAGVYREGMAESRELYDYTFRMVGQRLSRAERRVADFALDAIPARLEKLLLEFSSRYGISETTCNTHQMVYRAGAVAPVLARFSLTTARRGSRMATFLKESRKTRA
jgi:CRP-like cAMP-binding protein